jgi:hypothetical protein
MRFRAGIEASQMRSAASARKPSDDGVSLESRCTYRALVAPANQRRTASASCSVSLFLGGITPRREVIGLREWSEVIFLRTGVARRRSWRRLGTSNFPNRAKMPILLLLPAVFRSSRSSCAFVLVDLIPPASHGGGRAAFLLLSLLAMLKGATPATDFFRACADENVARSSFYVFSPVAARAPLPGFWCSRRQFALLLRLLRPWRLRSPSQSCSESSARRFLRTPANAELRHLGAWPTRRMVPRSTTGQFNETETLTCTRTK